MSDLKDIKVGMSVVALCDDYPMKFPKNSTGKVIEVIGGVDCAGGYLVKSDDTEESMCFLVGEVAIAVEPTPYWKYVLGTILAATWIFIIAAWINEGLNNV